MIVMKFGGSSIAGAERIRHVAGIVRGELARTPVLVLSAMGDTTDLLLDAAERALRADGSEAPLETMKQFHRQTIRDLGLGEVADQAPLFTELEKLLAGIALIKELTPRTKDYLVSFGERLSVRIVAAYFNAVGIASRAFDAWDAGFISDSNYSKAWLLKKSWELIPEKLNPVLDAGLLPVVTGFIARDEKGIITTLGRGGSDLSATVIGAACLADEVQVWKDVDGILTADPRIVPDARPLDAVTYEEAAELAYFGAQVLHPRAMQPCANSGTPVLVKNSFRPEAPGTRIVNAYQKTRPVQAISSRKNVTLIDIVSTRMVGQYGFLAEVFSIFARQQISVDMVATSEVSISLTVDADQALEEGRRELERIAHVSIKTGKAIVTIVGDVCRSSEILRRAAEVCVKGNVQIQMVSQGASKVNISFIVNDTEAGGVVKALHTEFFG
jgi:aspartate kinase